MNLIIAFIILNIINVLFQTLYHLTTVKCSKWIASIVGAITFGLYTIVIVYTMCELPLLEKAVIVAICNFIGVLIVKTGEEKIQKDQLWKIELTILETQTDMLNTELTLHNLSYNYFRTANTWTIFNIYCSTKQESEEVKKLVEKYEIKYFASENKIL